MSEWTALLDGELADRAWLALRAIARDIAAFDAPVDDLATFWSYVAPALGEGDGDAQVRCDAALDRLGTVDVTTLRGSSLFRGLAGLGWTIQHCSDGAEEFLAEIDIRLIEMLGGDAWTGQYDLISGLAGLGVYFVERAERGASPFAARGQAEIVRHLANTAVRTPEGITWHTGVEHLPPHSQAAFPTGWYNVGLAHGVPGVTALLGKLPRSQTVDELRAGSIDWVMAQRTSDPAKSRFPAYAETPPGRPARTGWCYGDLGVAVALWDACARGGEVARLPELEAIALAALGRSLEEGKLVDGAMCHGTVGLAHIANRFFHATGRAEFRDAAVHWYGTTLDLARRGLGIGGFGRWNGSPDPEKHGWETAPDLLDGAGGVGLALAAAVTPIEPAWDRLFLVDLPIKP